MRVRLLSLASDQLHQLLLDLVSLHCSSLDDGVLLLHLDLHLLSPDLLLHSEADSGGLLCAQTVFLPLTETETTSSLFDLLVDLTDSRLLPLGCDDTLLDVFKEGS